MKNPRLNSLIDTIKKDLEKLTEEFQAFATLQSDNLRRLSKPSFNPKNREHFVPHVLTGALVDTFRSLPKTLAYLTPVVIVLHFV